MKEGTVAEESQSKAPEARDKTRSLAPPVDIFEVPDGLAVVVDMPGVEKDGVDVCVEKDLLTISGVARASSSACAPVRSEYELGNYFRQFQLDEEVDQNKIKAEMKYGVLTIHLPKAQMARPKKIDIAVKP